MDQFEKVIDKYGPAFMSNIAAPVWEAAVRQVLVVGVLSAAWAVVFLVGAVIAYRASRHLWMKRSEFLGRDRRGEGQYHDSSVTSEDTDLVTCGAVVLSAAPFVFVFLALMFIAQTIQYTLNPVWYAIQNLGGLVK